MFIYDSCPKADKLDQNADQIKIERSEQTVTVGKFSRKVMKNSTLHMVFEPETNAFSLIEICLCQAYMYMYTQQLQGVRVTVLTAWSMLLPKMHFVGHQKIRNQNF